MPDLTETAPVENDEIAQTLASRLEASKRVRKANRAIWKRNVESRLGKTTSLYTGGLPLGDEDLQSEINPDWSLTKTKIANLYSQVPTVQLTHENKQYAAAVPLFAKALNFELGPKRTHIGTAMEEVLSDTVNAAGIGGIYTGYAARFETVDLPVEEVVPGPTGSPMPTKGLPPEVLQGLVQAGTVHLTPTPRVASARFFQHRISPNDLLSPADFTGSNFDDADYVGYSGRCSWPEALVEFKLRPEDQEAVISEGETEEDLRSEPDQNGLALARTVHFDRLFYWRYRVDPDELYFEAIWTIVWVAGKSTPVIHEAWTGQRLDQTSRRYVGATIFPVQFLTLTYVTDNPIPPSDTAAGRPQVLDLRRSRSQMFLSRDRSIPIRGFNTNRVDPLIQDNLLRGTIQGWIPFNGGGQESIWEVARASYPAEDFTFDRMTQEDLRDVWQIGPNQTGQLQGRAKTSASEVQITQANFSRRMGQEQGRCAAFFLRCCEVLAGLMALYSDFPVLSDQERQTMQQAWDQQHILHDLVLNIRPDSTVVLDTQTRIQRLFQALNMTAQSGYVNPKPIITEILELSGIDPSTIVIDPQPKPPDEPTISLRLSGKEDLANVLVMATLIGLKRGPSPENIEAAKQLLAAVSALPQPGVGQPPEGPPGSDVQAAPPMGDARPDWGLTAKIAKRSRDLSPGG